MQFLIRFVDYFSFYVRLKFDSVLDDCRSVLQWYSQDKIKKLKNTAVERSSVQASSICETTSTVEPMIIGAEAKGCMLYVCT